jgi:hypothetical protein
MGGRSEAMSVDRLKPHLGSAPNGPGSRPPSQMDFVQFLPRCPIRGGGGGGAAHRPGVHGKEEKDPGSHARRRESGKLFYFVPGYAEPKLNELRTSVTI